MTTVFLLHILTTFIMLGLILTIQIVHYPLFAEVGAEQFIEYEKKHQFRITFIVAPVMGLELITGGLLWLFPPFPASQHLYLVNLNLLVIIWLSTAFLQMPIHMKLAENFDKKEIIRLCRTNWIRTVAWAARSALLCYILTELI